MDQIQQELELKDALSQCDIEGCQTMKRHYRETLTMKTEHVKSQDDSMLYTYYVY